MNDYHKAIKERKLTEAEEFSERALERLGRSLDGKGIEMSEVKKTAPGAEAAVNEKKEGESSPDWYEKYNPQLARTAKDFFEHPKEFIMVMALWILIRTDNCYTDDSGKTVECDSDGADYGLDCLKFLWHVLDTCGLI